MDGLTVISEEQRIHLRAATYWLVGVAAGWPLYRLGCGVDVLGRCPGG
jgi:hypothetical protein